MILSYKTHFDKKKTKRSYFPEKILRGLEPSIVRKFYDEIVKESILSSFWDKGYNFDPDMFGQVHPKIHTIREDITKRWKPGNKIHHAINSRTPNYFQFAPIMPCKSVQEIEIHNHDGKGIHLYTYVKVDGRQLSNKEIILLALSDGFDSVKDFFTWFNADHSGRIIHWTDRKY